MSETNKKRKTIKKIQNLMKSVNKNLKRLLTWADDQDTFDCLMTFYKEQIKDLEKELKKLRNFEGKKKNE